MKQARVIGLASGNLIFDENGNRIEKRCTLSEIVKKDYLKNGYYQMRILLEYVSNGEKGSKDYNKPLKLIKDYHKRVNGRKKRSEK